MHIVDSQVHLWAAESPDRPWPPGRAPEAQKPYPIVKETMLFQMDLAKVSRVVIAATAGQRVQAAAGGADGVEIGLGAAGAAPLEDDDLAVG